MVTTPKRKTYKLDALVAKFGGQLIGGQNVRVGRVATLESAGPGDLTFLAQPKYLSQLGCTRAAAVVLAPEARDSTQLPRIVTPNPYAYFAKVSEFFNPVLAPQAGIHGSAVVARSARIAKSASIGACTVIDSAVHVGEQAVVGPNCYLGERTSIGSGTRLHANVTIYHDCTIGRDCVLHAGAVIGADGFGLANEDGVWKKIPQVGGVKIGDNVEVGANTTIDRGALDDTVIEDGVKLDNQIQIGHNVRIGAHSAIAACVGIAGSTKIGSRCMLGGAAMIGGHITIASGTTVSGGSVIMKSIDKPGVYTGIYPVSAHQRWRKNAVHLRRLDELAARIDTIENEARKARGDKS
jgi:UDP-3-O-[3-hydroxymyristoyl] glucosamine N-acyltransferase